MSPPDPARLDLGALVENVRAKQHRRPPPPAGHDAAARAAHDYEPDDDVPPPSPPKPRPTPPPPAPPTIPEHLRQYLVSSAPVVEGRLELARTAPHVYASTLKAEADAAKRAGRALDERGARARAAAAVADAWAFGYLGMDWAGLARMAEARRGAGLPLDDLDDEALRRADELKTETSPADT